MSKLTKQLKYILGLGLIVVLAACGGTADNSLPEDDDSPSGTPLSISITTSPETVVVGGDVIMNATVAGDGSDSGTVSWTSTGGTLSATSGLEVSWTAPVGAGKVTITASIDADVPPATITIEVGLCSSGSVTDPADPCLIRNIHQLQAITEHPAGNFALDADIDAAETATWNNGRGFRPIGIISEPKPDEDDADDTVEPVDFTGSLDGRGHEITGLYINRPTTDKVGMFHSIGAPGVIRNLVLIDANVTGRQRVGTLAGSNGGNIKRSSADEDTSGTAKVTGTRSVGGLVGENLGTIEHSHGGVTVTANGPFSGGLVGFNGSSSVSSAAIRHSSASSPLVSNLNSSGSADNGGLVGHNHGTISDSYSNSARVESQLSDIGGGNTGGLVGYNQAVGVIERSYTTSSVKALGKFNVGGLVGMNWGEITQSYSLAASAEATVDRAGGLVGYNRRDSLITETYSTTDVTAPENAGAGGLVGENEPPGGSPPRPAGSVLRSFWDMQNSGQGASAGGSGVTTQNMHQASTFTFRNWNFDDVWQINEGRDSPDLRSNPR